MRYRSNYLPVARYAKGELMLSHFRMRLLSDDSELATLPFSKWDSLLPSKRRKDVYLFRIHDMFPNPIRGDIQAMLWGIRRVHYRLVRFRYYLTIVNPA
jgi:hypothetical protein